MLVLIKSVTLWHALCNCFNISRERTLFGGKTIFYLERNKKMKKTALRILVVSVLVLMLAAPVLAVEKEMTVIGEVNNDYQIVTDQGVAYEVEDTDMGNELLNHVGKKVEVTGTVTEEDEVQTIKVASYVILEDKKEE
jgi:hypothetical protein